MKSSVTKESRAWSEWYLDSRRLRAILGTSSSELFDEALESEVRKCATWACSRLGFAAEALRLSEKIESTGGRDGVLQALNAALGTLLALLRFVELNLVAVRRLTQKRDKLAARASLSGKKTQDDDDDEEKKESLLNFCPSGSSSVKSTTTNPAAAAQGQKKTRRPFVFETAIGTHLRALESLEPLVASLVAAVRSDAHAMENDDDDPEFSSPRRSGLSLELARCEAAQLETLFALVESCDAALRGAAEARQILRHRADACAVGVDSGDAYASAVIDRWGSSGLLDEPVDRGPLLREYDTMPGNYGATMRAVRPHNCQDDDQDDDDRAGSLSTTRVDHFADVAEDMGVVVALPPPEKESLAAHPPQDRAPAAEGPPISSSLSTSSSIAARGSRLLEEEHLLFFLGERGRGYRGHPFGGGGGGGLPGRRQRREAPIGLSLFAQCSGATLHAAALTAILPTCHLYAASIGARRSFVGVLVGAAPVASLLAGVHYGGATENDAKTTKATTKKASPLRDERRKKRRLEAVARASVTGSWLCAFAGLAYVLAPVVGRGPIAQSLAVSSRAALGVGVGRAEKARRRIIADALPPNARSIAASRYVVAAALGAGLGPILAAFVAATTRWKKNGIATETTMPSLVLAVFCALQAALDAGVLRWRRKLEQRREWRHRYEEAISQQKKKKKKNKQGSSPVDVVTEDDDDDDDLVGDEPPDLDDDDNLVDHREGTLLLSGKKDNPASARSSKSSSKSSEEEPSLLSLVVAIFSDDYDARAGAATTTPRVSTSALHVQALRGALVCIVATSLTREMITVSVAMVCDDAFRWSATESGCFVGVLYCVGAPLATCVVDACLEEDRFATISAVRRRWTDFVRRAARVLKGAVAVAALASVGLLLWPSVVWFLYAGDVVGGKFDNDDDDDDSSERPPNSSFSSFSSSEQRAGPSSSSSTVFHPSRRDFYEVIRTRPAAQYLYASFAGLTFFASAVADAGAVTLVAALAPEKATLDVVAVFVGSLAAFSRALGDCCITLTAGSIRRPRGAPALNSALAVPIVLSLFVAAYAAFRTLQSTRPAHTRQHRKLRGGPDSSHPGARRGSKGQGRQHGGASTTLYGSLTTQGGTKTKENPDFDHLGP